MKVIQVEDWKINTEHIAYYRPTTYWNGQEKVEGTIVGITGIDKLFRIPIADFEKLIAPFLEYKIVGKK